MAEPKGIAQQEAAPSPARLRTAKRKSKPHADANAPHTDQQAGRGLTLVITTDLRTDGGTQPRERLDHAVVRRYAEEMEAGLWDFAKSSAPITAFHDGETYWLADGAHRVEAAKMARLDELQVDLRQGGQRDAILYSVGANATHGYPRSSEDKRRAVFRLLQDPEWSKWADREIARRCCVTPTLVGKLRASLSTVDSEKTERTYTTKHGTIATMNTGAIGGKPKRPAERASDNGVGEPIGETADGLATIAAAQLCGVTSPDAGASPVIDEPVRELQDELAGDASLPERQAALEQGTSESPYAPAPGRQAADGRRMFQILKGLFIPDVPLPSQPAVDAMNVKERKAIRKLAEQSRMWAAGLLEMLDWADGSNA